MTFDPNKLSKGYLDTIFDYLFSVKPNLGATANLVVTLLRPTSEAGVRFPGWPQVGKLVVTCRWSAVYSKEP